MARFLACMLVSEEYEAILTRCCIRYSRVLRGENVKDFNFRLNLKQLN